MIPPRTSGLFKARDEGPPSRIERLVYAVGDIHGRSDLLVQLLQMLRHDAAQTCASRPLLILLGDYIDRGPDSRGVVDLLLQLRGDEQFELRLLRGNHESLLCSFLANAEVGPTWASLGGGATLESYGVAAPSRAAMQAEWEESRRRLEESLPRAHRDLLENLNVSLQIDDYLFVHAGVRPRVALERQRESDLLWIREAFTQVRKACPFVVVHGHTPARDAQLTRWRIGLDTGAYLVGRLTAVRLCGAERTILQAVGSPGR